MKRPEGFVAGTFRELNVTNERGELVGVVIGKSKIDGTYEIVSLRPFVRDEFNFDTEEEREVYDAVMRI